MIMVDSMITDGQRFAMLKLFGYFAPDRNARLWILSQIFNREIKSISELTLNEWHQIRDRAYLNWADGDWTVSEEFIKDGHRRFEEYEEKILGQEKLF